MSLGAKELDELLSEAVEITEETDKILLEGLNRPKNIVHKGEVDLVTEYDLRVENVIVERLTQRFPNFGVLAEEGTGSEANSQDTVWIIDPLDGTTNYSHGHPFFATSIGLEHCGELVVGVISVPRLHDRYTARKNGGAFKNKSAIKVSKTENLDTSLVATGFPYDRRAVEDDNTREYRAFMKCSQGVRRCGAAAVDMAQVACGVYDGFWEPRLKPWDLAAGLVLVQEAGGNCSDYRGAPLNIRKGWVIASNNLIHKQMLDVVAETRSEISS